MNENENVKAEETKPELTTKMVEKETFTTKAKSFFKTHWKKLAVGGGLLAAFVGGGAAQKKYDDLKGTAWSNEPEPEPDCDMFGGPEE